MRKVETAMVQAIRDTLRDPYAEGRQWKGGNTIVFQTLQGLPHVPGFNRWVEVILYETVVARIEPQAMRISVYSGGFRTATTRSRLNAILQELGDGFYIQQHRGDWGLYRGGYFYMPFSEGQTLTLRP